MAKSSTRLVLICGLPASGKSALARQLARKIPAIRLDKDGWATQLGADVWDEEFRVRLEHQLWVLSQDLLAQGQSVILEWGHERHVGSWPSPAHGLRASIRNRLAVVLKTPSSSICSWRARRRSRYSSTLKPGTI